jgi:hypothetical protein
MGKLNQVTDGVWGRMRTGSPAPTGRTWSRPEGGRALQIAGFSCFGEQTILQDSEHSARSAVRRHLLGVK